PVISGNVSLYNQSKGEAIYPTPITGMVGLLEDVNQRTPNNFQQLYDLINAIGDEQAEFAVIELKQIVNGSYSGQAPFIDLAVEAERQKQLLKAIQENLIVSATDISEGGLAIALAESVFNENELGVNISLEGDATVQLFSETQSRFIV